MKGMCRGQMGFLALYAALVCPLLSKQATMAGGAYALGQNVPGADINLTNGAMITTHNREALVSAFLIGARGFTVAQNASSTFGKLQLENPAGTNFFGGDVIVSGSSTTFGTLFRVLDDNQLNSAVGPSGKATVVLQGGSAVWFVVEPRDRHHQQPRPHWKRALGPALRRGTRRVVSSG